MPGSEPLSLEGFLDQERRLVNASEAQHIHNKMVYDAVNEALLGVYRAANRIQVRACVGCGCVCVGWGWTSLHIVVVACWLMSVAVFSKAGRKP